jgi:hypothetical protein
MLSCKPDNNLIQLILNFLKILIKNTTIHTNTKLMVLDLESIDYIEMAAFIFKTTGQWLAITKINNETRILDIPSCLIDYNIMPSVYKGFVKLDAWQQYVYSHQLKQIHHPLNIFFIKYLCLNIDIDIPRLEQAISQTLENHFILNSKLVQVVNNCFFVSTPMQATFGIKRSLFPKKEIEKLIPTVHSDRLVSIYLQKRNKEHYLIIAYHHIALDGWSSMLVQEEIFRRYAGQYDLKPQVRSEEINALNSIYTVSSNEEGCADELETILSSINPYEYNQIACLFNGKTQYQCSSFVFTKTEIDQYALKNSINSFSYSEIFYFLFHQMISYSTGVTKLVTFISLSNRYLPVPNIKKLITNLVTALPVFLDNKNLVPFQFTEIINKTFAIYFKNMNYGAISRVLSENKTPLNKFICFSQHPYLLLYTYVK